MLYWYYFFSLQILYFKNLHYIHVGSSSIIASPPIAMGSLGTFYPYLCNDLCLICYVILVSTVRFRFHLLYIIESIFAVLFIELFMEVDFEVIVWWMTSGIFAVLALGFNIIVVTLDPILYGSLVDLGLERVIHLMFRHFFRSSISVSVDLSNLFFVDK